jgi:hypothetical protein
VKTHQQCTPRSLQHAAVCTLLADLCSAWHFIAGHSTAKQLLSFYCLHMNQQLHVRPTAWQPLLAAATLPPNHSRPQVGLTHAACSCASPPVLPAGGFTPDNPFPLRYSPVPIHRGLPALSLSCSPTKVRGGG